MSTNGKDQGNTFRTKTQVGTPRQRANVPGPTDKKVDHVVKTPRQTDKNSGQLDQETFNDLHQTIEDNGCNINWKMLICVCVTIVCVVMLVYCVSKLNDNAHNITEISHKITTIREEIGELKEEVRQLKQQVKDDTAEMKRLQNSIDSRLAQISTTCSKRCP